MQQIRTNGKRAIIVEGNIGAGKTTFLNHMSRHTNVQILFEPLEKWTNLNGINLLERFYEDPGNFSYTFQNYAMLTYLENHLIVAEKDIKIMERSIYSGRYCFEESLWLEHKIDRASHEVFVKWFEYAEKCIQNRDDLIVYLRTTPEIVYDRIQKRNRNGEKILPFEYILRLHNAYEAWLTDTTTARNKIPVFIMDANLPSQSMRTEYDRLERYIASSPPPGFEH